MREGDRLCLVDAVLEQDGEPVARASGLFLRPSEPATGEVWEPDDAPRRRRRSTSRRSPTARGCRCSPASGSAGRRSFAEHQNGGRKIDLADRRARRARRAALAVRGGRRASPTRPAWSPTGASNGVEHINTDITLTLARQPVGVEVGLPPQDRVAADGIAVGTVTVFDREGRLGTAVVSSVANAERTVDSRRAPRRPPRPSRRLTSRAAR